MPLKKPKGIHLVIPDGKRMTLVDDAYGVTDYLISAERFLQDAIAAVQALGKAEEHEEITYNFAAARVELICALAMLLGLDVGGVKALIAGWAPPDNGEDTDDESDPAAS